ncbi:hypothetical protein AMTRI_Chr03g142390 [Amborella trichopoda]
MTSVGPAIRANDGPGLIRFYILLARHEGGCGTSLVCQQDNVEQQPPGRLLEPLPTPGRPWESVSLDFISAFPQSEGYGSIIVVVDRLSKCATFVAAPKDLFWTELFKLLVSNLQFSTIFHPQTDGQTEIMNALLELYLRHFVSANQKDWAKLLDVAQFFYNLEKSESTGHSPFKLVTGQQPLTPNSLMGGSVGRYPPNLTYLNKATERMKKWADMKRWSVMYNVGDLVLIKLLPQQFKAF